MLNKLITATISLFVFLIPLFYLPTTPDSYEFNKMFLLGTVTVLLFVLLSVKIAFERRFHIYKTAFGIPLIILFAVVLLSSLFQSLNLTVAFITPLSTGTILFGIFLYYILVSLLSVKDAHLYLSILVFDGILISLFFILQNFGILPKSPYTPLGNLTATAIFLAIIGLYSFVELAFNLKNYLLQSSTLETPHHDETTLKQYTLGLYAFSFFITMVALVLAAYHLFGDQKPYLLPYSMGSSILMQTGGNVKTLLFGVGPANFFTAFTMGKPASINATPLWNIIFTTSSSFWMTLTTEAGFIAGILFLILFILSVLLLVKHWGSVHRPVFITLVFTLFLQIVLPGSMSLFLITILLLALCANKKTVGTLNLSPMGPSSNVLILPSLFLCALFLYMGSKSYRAEMLFKQSLDALLNNQAGKAYSLQTDAIGLSPNIDRYHLASSQTGMAVANTYASDKDAKDEDKQKIPQLVQQSINEGRIAVSLGKTSINNWNNLAQIYTSLIDIAEGSETWGAQSFEQLIILDPLNPNHRVSFGGMYLRAKKYDLAEKYFREAISLKPDFANAHYNLAYVLQQEKKNDEAYQELQTTLTFIDPDSVDGQKVQKEMNDLISPPAKTATDSASLQENTTAEIKTASPASTFKDMNPSPALDQSPNLP